MKPPLLVCGLCGILVVLSGLRKAEAAIIADFTAGNTSTSVDGYVGMAGNGWENAWATKTTNLTINTATVMNTAPLKTGAGNYLYVSVSSAAGASGPAMSVNRHYGAAGGGVSLTSETSFSFLFRGETGSSSDYRYAMFDTTASQTGTSSANTWAVVASGGSWYVQNGTSLTSTGLAFNLGTTYALTVAANPADSSWTLQIADVSGSVLYTSTELAFRSTATTLGGYLTYSVADTSTTSASNYAFSVDSIAIVPEPHSVALALAGGGVLAGAVLRRRRASEK